MHLFLYLVISDEFRSDISLWTAVQTMKLTDQKVWSLWILTIHIFSQSHQDFVKYTFFDMLDTILFQFTLRVQYTSISITLTLFQSTLFRNVKLQQTGINGHISTFEKNLFFKIHFAHVTGSMTGKSVSRWSCGRTGVSKADSHSSEPFWCVVASSESSSFRAFVASSSNGSTF